jgi:hypothetical protein
LIYYFLLYFVLLSFETFSVTTGAIAEDKPFGTSKAHLINSNFQNAVTVDRSDYQYITDIPKNNDILIAIIDDYMSSSHDSLKMQYWLNYIEITGKPGDDDDNNGYIDDYHGWNFYTNQPYEGYHSSDTGNEVASTIAGHPLKKTTADGYNHTIRGINPNVKIMRLYQPSTAPLAVNDAKSIRYAVDNGAQVIVIRQLPEDTPEKDIFSAISYANEQNIMVIYESDHSAQHAEVFQLTNAVSVANNTYTIGQGQDTDIYKLSSPWNTTVKYCLPENLIMMPDQEKTRFSAPVLAGIVSRLLMYNNQLTPNEIVSILNENSVVSTGIDDYGTAYECHRPSGKQLFQNFYGGKISNQSIRVTHENGKSIVLSVVSVMDLNGQSIRRKIVNFNIKNHRYWLNHAVN